MQTLQQLFTQCRALYDQWLIAGGFSANGMFMEGHYCIRESVTLAEVDSPPPTQN
ncbi:hypothetical protein SAMN05216522_1119 [Rosenbergiella nectarea]|uniref:Uncharacterized protein n=1 Tax=Rosenbergiella nectarea TaxID=988801 RepID=A0A1H9LAB5_9GAMM|nr:hypothetical protein [Rosenbergiella nectarea]SER08085.1 hypothetical protein SAMN05216522_1119 [Rosenbergiella nectarea]